MVLGGMSKFLTSPLQSIRGRLVSLNELGITVGFLLAYFSSYIFIHLSDGWWVNVNNSRTFWSRTLKIREPDFCMSDAAILCLCTK